MVPSHRAGPSSDGRRVEIQSIGFKLIVFDSEWPILSNKYNIDHKLLLAQDDFRTPTGVVPLDGGARSNGRGDPFKVGPAAALAGRIAPDRLAAGRTLC
jgi:hypothetical protein